MSRLTITLEDDLHRALKESAARQGRSITAIIEESLRLRGIKGRASAKVLVEQARKNANLDADTALEIAIEETRARPVALRDPSCARLPPPPDGKTSHPTTTEHDARKMTTIRLFQECVTDPPK